MIPLGTYDNPTKRRPYLTYGLILINILVFLWEMSLSRAQLTQAFWQYGLVPCNLFGNFAPNQIANMFASMFLHGGIWHLIGNMTFLWIFGTNLEDYLGRRWYLIAYFGGGIAAHLTHSFLYHYLCIPTIGASGAIAAVMGAYLIVYPGVRVRIGLPFFRFFILPLTLPAYMMLGLWFILQVFNGITSLGVPTGGGVAFFAHIGGFLFGLVFAFFFVMVKGAPDPIIYSD